MKIKNLLFALLVIGISFHSTSFASELIIKRGNKSAKIQSVNLRGTEYVSSREFSKIIGANYYFNSEKGKSEIKFIDYNLKFTANNQFVILTAKKSNQHQIFQLPISAKLRNGDVFIPVKYSVKYFSYASGLTTTFNENNNTVSIVTSEVNTKELVSWNKTLVDRSSIKYDIFSAKIENKSNGTLLRLSTKREIRQPSSSISNNTLYIFFSDATIDKNELLNLKVKGFIRKISVKHVDGNPQLEIKLREGFDKYELFYDEEIGEILISIHNKYLKDEKALIEDVDKWKFDAIVLSPGHGGRDPGTIGINGVKEKDINLAIAKELGSLINKNIADTKVIYARKDDRFVELYKRGKIANENKGSLYISIHCNSTPRKPSNASGFEVYLLRPGRTKEAIGIAELENSVISLEEDPTRYKQLNDENFILVSMAHSSNMRYSETFADMLNTEWIKQVKIPSRGIKQAGFYELVGASMPSVLIETGFLSNKKDVKFLSSKSGQKKIAKTILDAIIKYKNYYETSLNTELDK